jgi:hypothetical protein
LRDFSDPSNSTYLDFLDQERQTSTSISILAQSVHHHTYSSTSFLTLPQNQFGKFTVNGVEYANPTVSVLLQIVSGAPRPNDLLQTGSVYQLLPNKAIEISMLVGFLGIEVRYNATVIVLQH